MYKKINNFSLQLATNHNPWTNVYGLARSLIAFSTLITLLFNDVSTFFKPMAGVEVYPACSVYPISIFCLFPNHYFYLGIIKWVVIILLAIIASGWRPRYTGLLHWWIASSIQNTAVTLDGGEQVAVVLTFLLIPITILDNRKWHWTINENKNDLKERIHTKIISLVFLYAIRFQMSIIYFHASIAKVKNPEWIDGTAVYYYFNDPMLGVNSSLLSILNPILTSSFVPFISWGSIIIEIMLGAGLFAPKKYWNLFLLLGFSLHIGIALLLGLYSFSMIMCAGLILAFRPSERVFSFLINKEKENKDVQLYNQQELHTRA